MRVRRALDRCIETTDRSGTRPTAPCARVHHGSAHRSATCLVRRMNRAFFDITHTLRRSAFSAGWTAEKALSEDARMTLFSQAVLRRCAKLVA